MQLIQLRVREVKLEANEVISIVFEPLDSKVDFSYKAGQFLTLVFNQNEKEIRRSYSLYSSPIFDKSLSIAVKLVENGEISRLLHHQVKAGDVLWASNANGQFTYEPELNKQRTVFLFAAGVGITPLFSILKTILVAEENSKVVLVYSSRSPGETLFINELKKWKNNYEERLDVVHLFSNSKNLRFARLNSFLIAELIAEKLDFDKDDALFYTCGPVDYMDVCRIAILGLGFQNHQFNRETFVLHEDEIDEDDTTEKQVDKSTYSVSLIINKVKHNFDVPYPKRILEVALENGVKIPYSCSGGVCGTCVGKCIAGAVSMAYNEVLTDDELKNGSVLVCTGRPTENDTVIVWE